MSNNTNTIIYNREFALPSAWTFEIEPIKKLLQKYVGNGIGWIEPFAGKSNYSEFRNDINPERKQPYCMDAIDFCETLKDEYNGIIFDPPYSYRQVTEHYKDVGIKATQLDTSSNFYSRVMDSICDKIKLDGYAISMGWNSNGFGKNRGFKIVEILMVAHGGHHNDTIIVVEKKTYRYQTLFDTKKYGRGNKKECVNVA
jgi:hypothetical protein